MNTIAATTFRIIDVEQGSPEWFEARAGIPTASEFSALVTPKTRKISTGDGVRTYRMQKLAERWMGRAVGEFVGSFAMEQGKILEDEAIPAFALETGLTGRKVGFVVSLCGRFGCSPDLLLDDGSGCEAKCPRPETHCAYLLAGRCPDEYFAQVQGAMHVTGAAHWWFASYARGFPMLIVKIPRDDAYQATLGEALDTFCIDLDRDFAAMATLNGGPPKRATKLRTIVDDYFDDDADLTPQNREFFERFTEAKGNR